MKGLAVAVHTRRLADPEAAFDRLLPAARPSWPEPRAQGGAGPQRDRGPLAGHAQGHRGGDLVDEQTAGAFVFVGDDLGDVDAFEAVRALRADGMATLLVCSGSEEENALVDLSDVLVHGPDGVLEFLRRMAEDAAG